MRLLGFTIERTKQVSPLRPVYESRGGWFPIVREGFTGAWQQNSEISVANVLTFAAVYACITLIAGDIGKLRLKLIQDNGQDVWTEAQNPAYSPVLRKPNRYQTRIKFFEQWLISKLITGNTYVLKQRNQSNKVEAMYILDPARVRPLVAGDGEVYYTLQSDTLAGQSKDGIIVPASEIIHDVMLPLYHPLVGVSPITACGLAAMQGLKIQDNSTAFFGNGAMPGGVLTAPGFIKDETAARLKAYWDDNFTGANAGKVAVLGDGLRYEAMTMKFTEAQLIEQLRWTAENVCTAFHVPPYKIGIGSPPSYNNIEALNVEYYSQALQNPIESIELLIDEGLSLPSDIGVEFDLDQLLRMDTPTRVSAGANAIGSSIMSPNEARKRFFGLGPVKGGDTPYMQQQLYSLASLDARDKAQAAPPSGNLSPQPQPMAAPADTESPPEDDDAATEQAKNIALGLVLQKVVALDVLTS